VDLGTAVASALFVVELVIDKISYLDSAWDSVHTFIRPLAGALLLDASDASASTIALSIAGATLALLAHGARLLHECWSTCRLNQCRMWSSAPPRTASSQG
jgi:hypothetical protein